eukprot:COSAG01_NODE_12152_length_1792_cov_1.943296_1_plen_295_part_01
MSDGAPPPPTTGTGAAAAAASGPAPVLLPRARWDACIQQLGQSTRPSAAEISDVMAQLAALPYPLSPPFKPDEIGKALSTLCRLARLNLDVPLHQLCELIVTLCSKHRDQPSGSSAGAGGGHHHYSQGASAISEGNMQTIVTFLCTNVGDEQHPPPHDAAAARGSAAAFPVYAAGPDPRRQRQQLLRALSHVLHGNGARCANLIDGILHMLIPDITHPYVHAPGTGGSSSSSSSAAAASGGGGGAGATLGGALADPAAWQEGMERQRQALDCFGSLFSHSGGGATDVGHIIIGGG